MFDLTSLPDLVVLTVLVFVFWSILRSRAGSRLHVWLLGWIFILLHFAVALFGGRPGALQTAVQCASAIMLELGGAAFIYAADGGGCTRRLHGVASAAVLATVLYIGLEYNSVASPTWYYVAAALLFAAGCVVFVPEEERPSSMHRTMAYWALALAVALAFLAYRGWQDYGDNCIFFVIYLLAGLQYWRSFPRRTTGALTAVIGFVAWACVFPTAAAFALLAPQIHIQSSVWNIPKYIVAIGILLTLLEEEIQQTEHLALHDPLTGLPNRRLLDDRLTKAVERAERNEGRVAVLLIDLDGFKKINDTYGHAVGDEVLRVVATRLQMRVRKADTIARTGGDEFVVVVSDLLQLHGADVLAGKLMADLNEPIVMEGVSLRPTASIGVAIYPEDGETVEDLRDKADISMYGQKRRDR